MTNLSERFSTDDLRLVIRELEAVGAGLATWYEAVRYDGDTLTCSFQLFWRRGLLRKEPMAVCNDQNSLGYLLFYLLHNAQRPWTRLGIRRAVGRVESGCFMIVERRGLRCPDESSARSVLKSLGRDDADADLLLSWVEETHLAYLLTKDQSTACHMTSVVQAGALGSGHQWK